MRLGNVLLVVIAIYFSSCNFTSAASGNTSHLASFGTAVLSDNGGRSLRSYGTNNGNDDPETEYEERAVSFSGAKTWFKTLIQKWLQNWQATREQKDAKKIASDLSPNTVARMLKNTRFKVKMFKKWNNYRMEDIKMKLAANLDNNPAVAVMLVDYVQNYRVYATRWKTVN
ncbi:hypothetical protein PHYPSEUDO_010094 [Phytophthora pseudosyringae]|uniref:RxLR effector protein n=1 Tax=Phytophthora pseudosyringae TaxID=221518 RepID=A0A8T1VG18_9STRA|nr:hypothetical protein PHYPSEUDO_010094 [Phytophthora pseudosyringae]